MGSFSTSFSFSGLHYVLVFKRYIENVEENRVNFFRVKIKKKFSCKKIKKKCFRVQIFEDLA